MNPLVTHLESAIDGTTFEPGKSYTVHSGRPMWVRYNLPGIRKAVSPAALAGRPATMWRFHEFLPPGNSIEPVSLEESVTPLIQCPRLARTLGLLRLTVKDESRLPTGSFKSRGLAMAITMARYFGVRRVAIPTAGNAGGAMAAYAARANLEAVVLMPADTPLVNQVECVLAGARVFRVRGLINDCGRMVATGAQQGRWFDLSTLKEPYRLEGKKTMGLELAEQLQWQLPDVIVYPTGGGTGLIGMWKAFFELAAVGWIDPIHRPRMIAVQATGCAPIVNAFRAGDRFAQPITGATTVAGGLRVPAAVGDFMILDAIRESGGMAVAVSDEQLLAWQRRAIALEGLSFCPETGAGLAACEQLRAAGRLGESEHVVVFNTAAAQKYVECADVEIPELDPDQLVPE